MYALVHILFFALVASLACSAQTGYGEPDWSSRNLATITKIYNLTLYPNQLPILSGGGKAVPPGLFNDQASGRISPVGNFTTFEDTIEYFFALAPTPQGSPLFATFTRAETIAFLSPCPEVASSITYLHTGVVNPGSPDNGKELTIVKQVAFWRFDAQGAVLNYDAWLPNLDQFTALSGATNVTDPTYQAASIQQLCGVAQTRCVGNNTQYASVDDCVKQLSQKTYGTYDEAWGDTVVCRTIHLILTLVRPDVHCPHVGPTGGGKCGADPYNHKYFNDVELFGRPQGTTFHCNRTSYRG